MNAESTPGVRDVADRWAGRARRALHRRPHADVGIAAVLYLATLLTTAATTPPIGRHLGGAGIVLGAVACGVLVLRHRFPVPVLVVSVLAAEAYLALYDGQRGMLVVAAPLVALYTVAETARRSHALAVGTLAVLALAGLHLAWRPVTAWPVADNVALAALGALAVAAGDATRHRRAYLAEVEDRARRAERDRAREARQALTEQRLRIARDLHDSVGHQLALINVQAGVAAYVLDGAAAGGTASGGAAPGDTAAGDSVPDDRAADDSVPDDRAAGDPPATARQALRHIRRASRAGLDELRDTIALLRSPDEEAAPIEPTLGLAGLDDLVATFRRSGLRIGRETRGAVRPLPAGTDLTAYRVIQESLTNACKHVTDASVRLRLEYSPAALRIVVDSAGRPVPAGPARGTGHGIVGMRERLAACGGTFSAGPVPGGGFQVTATLPLPGGAGTTRTAEAAR